MDTCTVLYLSVGDPGARHHGHLYCTCLQETLEPGIMDTWRVFFLTSLNLTRENMSGLVKHSSTDTDKPCKYRAQIFGRPARADPELVTQLLQHRHLTDPAIQAQVLQGRMKLFLRRKREHSANCANFYRTQISKFNIERLRIKHRKDLHCMQYYSTDCTTNTQRLYVCIVCNTIAQIAQSTQKTLQNFRTNPATNTERLCIVCNTIAQIAQSTWKAPTIPQYRLHYQHGKPLQYHGTDCTTNMERPCNTAAQIAQPTRKGPAIPQHNLRNQHRKALQYRNTDCATNTERLCNSYAYILEGNRPPAIGDKILDTGPRGVLPSSSSFFSIWKFVVENGERGNMVYDHFVFGMQINIVK